MNGLIFVGGIDNKLWINNGKSLSRNYKQGYRVYSSNGLASALVSQSVGGLGGYTGLYLVKVVGGFGKKKSNNGTQWYQQDRVYSSSYIAMCLPAGIPGGSYLYLVKNEKHK